MEEFIPDIQKSIFFKNFSAEELKEIAHHFSLKMIDKGVVWPADETLPMLMHTIIDGKISVYDAKGEITILVLKTGDVFGELVSTPCLPTKGQFKFVEDTKLITLSVASLEDMSTHHQNIAVKIFRNMLDKAYGRIDELHCGLCNTRAILQAN